MSNTNNTPPAPLPDVPAGYDEWELMGWGGLEGHQEKPWTFCGVRGVWCSDVSVGGTASAHPSVFYIRAVKRKPQPYAGPPESITKRNEAFAKAVEPKHTHWEFDPRDPFVIDALVTLGWSPPELTNELKQRAEAAESLLNELRKALHS